MFIRKVVNNGWLAGQFPGFEYKKFILHLLILLCMAIFIPASAYAGNKTLKIAFFNMMTPENYWWNNTSKVMEAACDDFGIKLDIYYADENQFLMTRQLQKVINTSPKVDAVIFPNVKQNLIQLLKIAEQAKIPAFVFNAGLSEQEAQMYGGPRDVFKYWIGEILPNDEQAGYDLAKNLFSQAKEKNLIDDTNRIQVLGIGGTISDMAAIERRKGLMKAVQEDPHIMLLQIAPAEWKRKRGQSVFIGLQARYPEARVVWVANDPMALGVIDGIKSLNITPGKDILVGSIDWIPDALTAVRNENLSVTIGGHFMESAWSIVMLYDYFHNNDFAGEAVSLKSKMDVLTKENIEEHYKHISEDNWGKVDFKQFSKTINPHIQEYDFTFQAITRQLVQ